jgi:pimeloyl-ACP methyl ester carboxylesterase
MTAYRERYYQSSEGLRLYYRDYDGDAGRVPVLCLPGLTRNSRDFDFIASHLSGRRRVLCADFRGRGKSDWDPNWKNYAIALEAADTTRLLDDAGADQAVILGTSRGGIVGMSLGVFPGLVTALILNDIGAEVSAAGMERLRRDVGRDPDYPNWETAAVALRERYENFFPDLNSESWQDFARALCREQGGRIMHDYDPALGEATRAGRMIGRPPDGNVSLWLLFDEVAGKPVLLIHAERSDILSAATVEKMREAKPDLEVVTLRERGHTPFLNEPPCVAAIDTFLDKLP